MGCTVSSRSRSKRSRGLFRCELRRRLPHVSGANFVGKQLGLEGQIAGTLQVASGFCGFGLLHVITDLIHHVLLAAAQLPGGNLV